MVELVSIPEDLDYDCFQKQKIIRFSINSSEETNLSDRIANYLQRGKIGELEPFLEFPEISMLDYLGNSGMRVPRVRLRVSEDHLGDIHRCRSQISSIKPTLVFEGNSASLPRSIQFLSSLNLPIEISTDVIIYQTAESLLDLADRLLFSPFIKTTVQPIFELLQALIAGDNRSPFSLWNACRETLGRDFFVSRNGKVSLSRRWADKNRYFGDISSTTGEMQGSPLYAKLKGIAGRVEFSSSECPGCQAENFCSGFLRALDDAYDCGPFLSLHAYLADQIPTLKKRVNALPRQKGHEIAEAISNSIPVPARGGGSETRPVPGPMPAIVYVSDKCINNCIFCAPAHKRGNGNELTDARIKDFILHCSARGTRILTLSGAGEPALNPSLADFVFFAKKAGIKKTFITSSGAAMSNDLISRLKAAGNDGFVFSLHGLMMVHDAAVQRNGAYDELLGAMRFARDQDMEVGLNTCLVQANLPRIESLVELGSAYCTMEHTLCFPEWSGNALNHKNLLLTYKQAFQQLANLKWSECSHVLLDNFPPCFVPPEAQCVRSVPVIQYMDLTTKMNISTALNFGNNAIPECCLANRCRQADICTGVDRQYLHCYGDGEFDKRVKEMRDAGYEF